MTERSSTERFVVVMPFASDQYADAAKDAALAQWWDRADAEGAIVAAPVVERLDPPIIDGEPMGFTYEMENGETQEMPPISAWRVFGEVRRAEVTR